jgi:hypothetical protein
MAEGEIRNQIGEVGRPGLVSPEPSSLHPGAVCAPDVVVRMIPHKQDRFNGCSNLRRCGSEDPLLRLLTPKQIRNKNARRIHIQTKSLDLLQLKGRTVRDDTARDLRRSQRAQQAGRLWIQREILEELAVKCVLEAGSVPREARIQILQLLEEGFL